MRPHHLLLQVLSTLSRTERALALDGPAFPLGRFARWGTESGAPGSGRPRSPLQPTIEPVVPWPVPLGQGLDRVRFPHNLGSRDEPGDQMSVCRRLPPEAWDQRWTRLWRTETTSAASAGTCLRRAVAGPLQHRDRGLRRRASRESAGLRAAAGCHGGEVIRRVLNA